MLYDTAVQARRREFAAERVLFKLVEYVEQKHPGLLDFIEGSQNHLGDPGKDDGKDDEAVREIARELVASARRDGSAWRLYKRRKGPSRGPTTESARG